MQQKTKFAGHVSGSETMAFWKCSDCGHEWCSDEVLVCDKCSPQIEVADHIHHIPTGEDWVVKRVDDTHVEPAGWPPCRAKLADCRLIKKATPKEREEMRRIAK